ncbi:archaetidylserine decarboxylase [Cellvibrio mixtus]|uniref:archaetidylserine decarboxylase n=1 Tax=Cellvibrio mixtus TaxID=39650 RepID=UPI00058748EE|nr:archaetidylserine decarboxylase [Cellvibrio mixtus]
MNPRIFIGLQHLVPQHALSRAAGWLASTQTAFIKNTFITWFVKRYQVDMSLAIEENPVAYACFNDFFTRALKPGARTIDSETNSIVCPADGAISQLGKIVDGKIFQAKGQDYTALELLGGDEALAAEFNGGNFATVYLSPRDYHRVHMPLGGKLRSMISVPGELFSVNTVTAENVPRLFARNERAVAIFDTEIGPMAVVLVGAMIVAGIETVWDGQIAPFASREIAVSNYPYQNIQLNKGDEMGRFKLGSTAIILFANNKMQWDEKFIAGTPTKMGEKMGFTI